MADQTNDTVKKPLSETELLAKIAELTAANAALAQSAGAGKDRFGAWRGRKYAAINALVESSKVPLTVDQIVAKTGYSKVDVQWHLKAQTRATKGYFQHVEGKGYVIHPDCVLPGSEIVAADATPAEEKKS